MNTKMKDLMIDAAREFALSSPSVYKAAGFSAFESGFEARDKIAQERESELLMIMADCADYLENTGSLTTATVSVFNTLRQALANYKAEDV